jgi:Tol biopolymer transport system component/PKD repeat protein
MKSQIRKSLCVGGVILWISTATRLAAIAACVWLHSAQPVAGQSAAIPSGQIAYDACYYYELYFVCQINVWTAAGVSFAAYGGVQPQWSVDGNRIAFVGSPDNGPGEIFLVNVGDLSVINLTDHPATDSAPAWSPDGTKIAFVSDRTGAPELYSVNHDGTNLVRLTNAVGFTGDFAWSPVGSTIALVREINGLRDLYKISGDGSMLVRLTLDVGFTGNFVWSPLGSTIAIVRTINGVPDLYRINADGSNLVRLTSGADFNGGFAWSPDGRRIAFDCTGQVCAVNADGTGLVHLADGVGGVFAPGSARIAFVAEGSDVRVREEDGTVVRVAPGIAGYRATWSPDGASVLFESAGPVDYGGCCSNACNADQPPCWPVYAIYVANADGSGVQSLSLANNPDWFRPRPGQPSASFIDQCIGSTCVFDASGSSDSDGHIATYTWGFGDGSSGTGSTATHTYTIGGHYEVTLTVVDNDGLTSIVGRTILANTGPVASFTSACTGGTCTFDASRSSDPDGSIASYSWVFGDRYTSSGPIVTHPYVSGTFVVQLTVTDNLGTTATASTTLQIVNPPPAASFTSVCNLFTCSFDATSSTDPDGSIQYYMWNFGDGSVGFGSITSHSYAAAGTYTVVLLVEDAAGQQAMATQAVDAVRGEMHVGDLDAYADVMPKASLAVHVTVTVHDKEHRPVGNATVNGLWWSGTEGWCTTGPTGQCDVWAPTLVKRGAAVSFTVQSVAHVMYVYQPPNHDPDGDSDGTTIIIRRP